MSALTVEQEKSLAHAVALHLKRWLREHSGYGPSGEPLFRCERCRDWFTEQEIVVRHKVVLHLKEEAGGKWIWAEVPRLIACRKCWLEAGVALWKTVVLGQAFIAEGGN